MIPRRSNPQRREQPVNRYVPPRHQDENQRLFLAGVPIDPSPRIYLEKGSSELTMRAMDLICPIGMGQRGLIVAPPGCGKTTFLKHLCQSITKGYPEIKLHCLLIDERPEEVTDFKRSCGVDVRSSSSDMSYEHHLQTADTLMADAFKETANGGNVMVVIDSLTRLARVHNAQTSSRGSKTMSGGVDSRAMEVPRRIFGYARKIEGAGSLTILATILIETGSRMDEVIFEEFKGTGNMEVVLSRDIAQHRIFPAIDISKSSTRKQELIIEKTDFNQIENLRRALAGMNKVEAAKALVDKLKSFPTNKELIQSLPS